MHKVKCVKSAELFPVINEFIQNNRKVRMAVTGNSMMPFLREGIDNVELSGTNFNELRFGQIPLIKRTNGQYILHRLVLKRKNSFYIAGDAQTWVEGPILPEQLIAVVTQVWRKDKAVSPSNRIWQIASFLWWLRLPARYAIAKPYKLIRLQLKKLLSR